MEVHIRKYGKIDANQREIITQLRKMGYSVRSTASLGAGFPDIIVGIYNLNFLFEIKVNEKSKLTEPEDKFLKTWKGNVKVITSADEAIETINKMLGFKKNV